MERTSDSRATLRYGSTYRRREREKRLKKKSTSRERARCGQLPSNKFTGLMVLATQPHTNLIPVQQRVSREHRSHSTLCFISAFERADRHSIPRKLESLPLSKLSMLSVCSLLKSSLLPVLKELGF